MKPEEQIKALAELDGYSVMQHEDGLWSLHNDTICFYSHNWETKELAWSRICKEYLTSYDAIIPLIQKIIVGETLTLKLAAQLPFESVHYITTDDTVNALRQTPSQLSEALLRATNKWKV